MKSYNIFTTLNLLLFTEQYILATVPCPTHRQPHSSRAQGQTQVPWAKSGLPPCLIQHGTSFLPGDCTELTLNC